MLLSPKKLEEELATRKKKESLLTAMPEAPVSPTQQLRDKHGTGGAILRMLGTGLSGGLLGDVLIPEMGRDSRAKYKSDLALHEKYREMALVDPQDQAYADALRNGTTGVELMALQAESAGLDKLNMDQTTLRPGEIRLDGLGNEIARGGPALPPSPTSVMQNARVTASGYGIPENSKAYADLIAAYAEPSGSRKDADGAIIPFNTVDLVLSRWENGYYNNQAGGQQPLAGQQGPQGQQGQPQVPRPDGGVTPAQATDIGLRATLNGVDQENLKIADQKIAFYNDLEAQLGDLGVWDPDGNDGEGSFTLNEDVTDIYGWVDGNPLHPQNWNGFGDNGDPGGFGGDTEFFMPQGNRDAKGMVERLINSLTVDERGKLKGQGQITEGETAMLKSAVTTLQKRGLGHNAIRREVERLMRDILRRRGTFQELKDRGAAARGETSGTGLPDGFKVDE